MRSQRLNDNFTSLSGYPAKEDILCYHHPSYSFNRETYQMSPLLFETDNEDDSESTEFKCYQEKTITPQSSLSNNLQIFNLLSTLNDLRQSISQSGQLDVSSQHNRHCSETLLNNSNPKPKLNLNQTYISPSPRVTRSRLLNSRILTRSARRLNKVCEYSTEYSETIRKSRKNKTEKDKRKIGFPNAKDLKSKASDQEKNHQELIESIRKSKVQVVVERLKFPFFQNPYQVQGKCVQPNIELNEQSNDFEFLNRRLSSEVLVINERPDVFSLSSDSTVRANTSPRGSPDLFENCESSLSILCSQSSFDIPNGQRLMSSATERVSETGTSTPNSQHDSTLVPAIFGLLDEEYVTPDVNVDSHKHLTNEGRKSVHQFEITVNEVFGNVINVVNSKHLLTTTSDERRNLTPPRSVGARDNLSNLIDLTKCASFQEVTPKRLPGSHHLLNKSLGASNTPKTLNRSKWLSKPKSDNEQNRTSQRCRRLDLWFHNDRGNKKARESNADSRMKFSKLLLTSSESEDS